MTAEGRASANDRASASDDAGDGGDAPGATGDASGAAGDGSGDAGGASAAREDDPTGRHDRLERHPTTGPRNSLRHWREAKGALRMTLNFVVVWMVRYSPSLKLKVWLMRRLGATVEDGVSFALTATPDVFWPELITVKADAIVGYDATILCHEFLQEEYRTGEVVIGERAMIGAGAVILPGVEIGHDARVGANAVVTRDVPPETTVTGTPATPTDDPE